MDKRLLLVGQVLCGLVILGAVVLVALQLVLGSRVVTEVACKDEAAAKDPGCVMDHVEGNIVSRSWVVVGITLGVSAAAVGSHLGTYAPRGR